MLFYLRREDDLTALLDYKRHAGKGNIRDSSGPIVVRATAIPSARTCRRCCRNTEAHVAIFYLSRRDCLSRADGYIARIAGSEIAGGVGTCHNGRTRAGKSERDIAVAKPCQRAADSGGRSIVRQGNLPFQVHTGSIQSYDCRD